jgi:hypothetical protein
MPCKGGERYDYGKATDDNASHHRFGEAKPKAPHIGSAANARYSTALLVFLNGFFGFSGADDFLANLVTVLPLRVV